MVSRRDRLTFRAMLALCVGTAASCTHGQLNEALGGRLAFEVFDATSGEWRISVSVAPAARVEWRAVVSYIGTNTDVFALGSIVYQPTFSNVDNTAAGGVDQLLPWRNGGVQGNAVAGSMVTTAEGALGSPLDTYGRVRFGATSASTNNQNVITTHRHGGDFASAGAPAGSWLRVAGSFCTSWPLASLPTAADATIPNLNAINRGVQANQLMLFSSVPIPPMTFHLAGTQRVVIFRGALQLSDLSDARTLELTSPAGTQQRVGGVNSGNDTRFMSWQTGPTDNGSWRVGVETVAASINVIPTPGAVAVLMGSGVWFVHRRQRCLLGRTARRMP